MFVLFHLTTWILLVIHKVDAQYVNLHGDDQTVLTGSTASLSCKYDKPDDFTGSLLQTWMSTDKIGTDPLLFFEDKRTAASDKRMSVSFNDEEMTLNISDVSLEDEMTYKCVLHGLHMAPTAILQLTVNPVPVTTVATTPVDEQYVNLHGDDQTVLTGSTASLSCKYDKPENFTRRPFQTWTSTDKLRTETILFFKNTRSASSDKRMSVSFNDEEMTLNISDVRLEDEMTYTCRLYGMHGIATASIQLTVNRNSKEHCDSETRYRCSSNNFCISRAKKCNGYWDCMSGEDEVECEPEFHDNKRDLQTALINGYTCSKMCRKGGRPCKGRKKSCWLDDECGFSCINKNAVCERPPPVVEHSIRYAIWKATPNGLRKIRPDSPTLYGYVASYVCEPGRRLEGLLPRCSGTKQWSNTVPVCVDFEKCGQAGNVGNIDDQARLSLQKTINGEDSNPNAWPWQALITKYQNSSEKVLWNNNLVGGGSIINKQWILTAAHVLLKYTKNMNWEKSFVISVGVFERPTEGAELNSTIEIYSIDKYIEHEDFSIVTLVNDIALIKLGARYNSKMQKNNLNTEGLVFSYYIRPVCLPCKGTCLTKEILLHGNVNLKGKGDAERCLAEEKILLENDAKVVATGFGHLDAYVRVLGRLNLPRVLQQVLLKIGDSQTCRKGIDDINVELGGPTLSYSEENNICCVSGNPSKVTDTCDGDSGGPVVRKVMSTETGEACWIQIGIVSFGLGCGQKKFPSYYTNVARFVPWIDSKIIDFDKCGQAGNVGNIDDQARLSLQRTINGEDSNPNAWPWQALITKYQNSSEKVLWNDNLVGGGSIINKQWILTAAHVLHKYTKNMNWEKLFVVSVGVFERPTDSAELKSTIEMYSIDKYIEHEDYSIVTLINDIAVIKLGARYDSKMQKNNSNTEGLVFSYYIRPVCLPCKGTCLTEEILLHGNVNLEGKGSAERCLAEEKILVENDATVVATGFGHLDAYIKILRRLNLPRILQQVQLKIGDSQTCRKGIDDINVELRKRGQPTLSYSEENNICCVSGDPNKVADTCNGDSGGPVVRKVMNTETGESCWIQIGIVSFGLGCGQKKFPSYHTNVARFIPWIDSKIIDFEKCGQAGDVGNIDDKTTLKDSNPDAWPWHALITQYHNSPEKVLRDSSLVGGGSIINRQWILTVTQLFSTRQTNWENNFVVAVGVFERPTDGAELKSTIEMYSIDKYIKHEDHNYFTCKNNIALIKLGARYDSKMQKNNSNTEGLLFSYYIRPVCLPCTGTCLTEEILIHGNVNLEGKGNTERCLAEEKILLRNDAKVVVTGFQRGYILRRVLQQVLLKIGNNQTCQKGMDDLNEIFNRNWIYSEDNNICFVSGNPNVVTDTCIRDIGSPVVKEVINTKTGEAIWIQIGITSLQWGCGQGLPSYFTNIARFISWIDSKIIDPLP